MDPLQDEYYMIDNQLDSRQPKMCIRDSSYYLDIDKALNGDAMELKQSLNGRWYFNYAKNPNERFVDFYKEDIDCHYFDMIDVPGHIQMQMCIRDRLQDVAK